MFIEIRKIKRLQKDGTRTCHAKQWPTPPSCKRHGVDMNLVIQISEATRVDRVWGTTAIRIQRIGEHRMKKLKWVALIEPNKTNEVSVRA
jgi:hypothetical protein